MKPWIPVAAALAGLVLLGRKRSCAGWSPSGIRPAPIESVEHSEWGTTYWCAFREGPFPGRIGALFVPNGVRGPCLNLAIHAHGHKAFVPTKIVQHALREQTASARAPWVLVMPQSAVLVRDSDPGRFDTPEGPARFVAEVLATLELAWTSRGLAVEYLLLSTHSGGFWTVGKFLEGAGDHVDDVVLIDSLYAADDEYVEWMDRQYRRRRRARWLNIHLRGDTADHSADVLEELQARRIPVRQIRAGAQHRTLASWPQADGDTGELAPASDVDVATSDAYPASAVRYPGYVTVDADPNPQRHTWLPLGNYRWILDTSGAR